MSLIWRMVRAIGRTANRLLDIGGTAVMWAMVLFAIFVIIMIMAEVAPPMGILVFLLVVAILLSPILIQRWSRSKGD